MTENLLQGVRGLLAVIRVLSGVLVCNLPKIQFPKRRLPQSFGPIFVVTERIRLAVFELRLHEGQELLL